MSNLSPINDETTKIFDEICEEQFAKLKLDVMNLTNVDVVGEDVLPHLAEQYHITGNEGWIYCQTSAEKRAFIKNAIKLHTLIGTKYAIKEALKTLNVTGTIKEWFEYNGEPYHFKVILEVFDRAVTSETEIILRNLINAYKNERSWLETIQLDLASKISAQNFSAVTFNETLTIRPKEEL